MNDLQFLELETRDLFMVEGGASIEDVATIGSGGALVASGCIVAFKGSAAVAAKTAVSILGVAAPGGFLVAAGVVGIAAGVYLIASGANALSN